MSDSSVPAWWRSQRAADSPGYVPIESSVPYVQRLLLLGACRAHMGCTCAGSALALTSIRSTLRSSKQGHNTRCAFCQDAHFSLYMLSAPWHAKQQHTVLFVYKPHAPSWLRL